MKFSHINKNKVIKKNKGFTLLEMLMVLSIFAIFTTVIMFNYSKFQSQIILSNTAYEIALQIREAQVYSLGVRSESTSGLDFDQRYGVFFSGTDQKNFLFFNDGKSVASDGVCKTTSNPTSDCDSSCDTEDSECMRAFKITNNIVIEDICYSNDDTPFTNNVCDNDETPENLSITFNRPNPDAIVKIDGGLGGDKQSAAVILGYPNSDVKMAIVVRSTGQISVENIQVTN